MSTNNDKQTYFDQRVAPIRNQHLNLHFTNLSHQWSQHAHASWVASNRAFDDQTPRGKDFILGDLSQDIALGFCNLAAIRYEQDILRPNAIGSQYSAPRLLMAQCMAMLGAQVAGNKEIEQILEQPPTAQLWNKLRGKLSADVSMRLKDVIKAKDVTELEKQRDFTARYCSAVSIVTLFSDRQAKDYFAFSHKRAQRLGEYDHHIQLVSNLGLNELSTHMMAHIRLGQKLANVCLTAYKLEQKNQARRKAKTKKTYAPRP